MVDNLNNREILNSRLSKRITPKAQEDELYDLLESSQKLPAKTIFYASRKSKKVFNDFALPENNSNPINQEKEDLFKVSRSTVRYLKYFDTNSDGKVSDDEAINYLLKQQTQKGTANQILYAYNKNARDFDRVISTFDKLPADGVFNDDELINALLALKTSDFSNIKYENAIKVLNRNTHLSEIKKIVDLIDKNSNGKISEIEVLDSVLAGKKGLLNLQDELTKSVLKSNKNFERIASILQNINPSSPGEISNKDVFEILINLRAGNLSQDQISKAMYLSKNSNSEQIASSVTIIDPDNNGQISNQEFVNFILNFRNGNIQGDQNLILVELLEKNSNFQNLLNIINTVDTNSNGLVSDEELIDFSLAVNQGKLNLDKDLTDLILVNNKNLKAIVGLIKTIDSDNNGLINDKELFNTIIDLNKGVVNIANLKLIDYILSKNNNKEQIELAINKIDRNQNGKIEDEEILNAEISYRKGSFTNINRDIFNIVIESNPNSKNLLEIYNQFDPDKDGIITKKDFIDKILDQRAGLVLIPDLKQFNQVIKVLDQDQQIMNLIEYFDTDKDGRIDDRSFAKGFLDSRAKKITYDNEFIDILAQRNPNSQIILDAISILDSDNNGVVSTKEFEKNFKASVSVNGVVDFNRMSIITNILDVIYPDAIKLDQFRDSVDINNDNLLSEAEIIDALLNLRNKSLENPGIEIIQEVLSVNDNYLKIIDTIEKIDFDKDGVISDFDSIAGLIAIRQGKFTNDQLPIAQAVLIKNPNQEELTKILNLFDKDLNGTISDLELLDALLKIRKGEVNYRNNLILENLKKLNPNHLVIENLIKEMDPNNSGTIDYSELVKGLLSINKSSLKRPSDE
ncbi:MAG: hypothetical protein RLZZ361_623, partial [Cyanobacteriota bacterium]